MQKIQIKNLSKSYGDHVVLSDLSLEIPYGKCTVIMGPSGCGKTTLLRIMMGLERADDGFVKGMPMRYSTVFQEDRLCMDFTAQENIAMVLPRGSEKMPQQKDYKLRENNREETIRIHLERVGLPGDSSQPIREYSGGMRRRVAIVRAVLASGDLLMLDEPFRGLDVETKQQAAAYLKEEQGGRTMLLVTHEEEEAQTLGDLVYRMEKD